MKVPAFLVTPDGPVDIELEIDFELEHRLLFDLARKVKAEMESTRPLTLAEMLFLYGDGSDDPGGLIPIRKRPLGLLDQAKPFPWTPPRRRPCSSPERARTYRRDLGRFTALTTATVIPEAAR